MAIVIVLKEAESMLKFAMPREHLQGSVGLNAGTERMVAVGRVAGTDFIGLARALDLPLPERPGFR
jgi:hypothetical protein